ncbi:MAG: ExeM/NucH family extracellular endonuclease, partial [Burkholderiaceae bacterium]
QDGNELSSEGVAVFYTGTSPVDASSIGDLVQFTAKVTEFFGLTELTTISNFSVVSQGSSEDLQSRTVTLPYADGTTLERYEGELVTFESGLEARGLFVGDAFTFGRFGEFVLHAGEAPYTYTQLNNPSVAGLAEYTEALARNSIIIEDNISTQNPTVATYQSTTNPYAIARDVDGNGSADVLGANNYIRVGDSVQSITGVLSFGLFGSPAVGSYELLPTAQVNLTANPRPEAPNESLINAGGTAEIRVATFNVLNYFTTLDAGGATFVNPLGVTHEPRGANTQAEFERQQLKEVNAIIGTGADILALNELQNNGFGDGTSAIDSLVDALNARVQATSGTDVYAYVSGPYTNSSGVLVPTAGSDAINVGFIYKSNVVQTLGSAFTPDTAVYTAFATNNRVPVAQTFAYLDDASKQVTLVANHFKSKSSGGTRFFDGDTDQQDGQSFFATTRLQAAVELAAWIQTNPTGATDGDYVILGDLNGYAREDSNRFLVDPSFDETLVYGNTSGPLPGYDIPQQFESLSGSYIDLSSNSDFGFVFDGLLGSLDHVYISAGLNTGEVTGIDHWHINSPEQTVLDYNQEFNQVGLFDGTTPYRASDHDPIVFGLRLNSEAGSPGNKAPTLVSSNPADNATGVTVSSDIVLSFSESIKAGTGNIVVTNETDQSTVLLDVRSGLVTITGNTVTVNPSANLAGNTTYNVQIASGVITDLTGLAFAGIAGADALDFTTAVVDVTAPTLVSSTPASQATGVAVGSNVVLTFSEAVARGTGSILFSAEGTKNVSIDVTDTMQVSISGNTVTVNPAANLVPGLSYSVSTSAGAFEDLAGNDFAGGGVTGFTTKSGTTVFINELHYDNNGTDVFESFAIAGAAGTDLTGWTVVLYNGNGGVPYAPNGGAATGVALSGTIDNEGSGFGELSFAAVGLQNGAPDGLALVNNSGQVVQFLSYEGSFTAVGGAANGLVSTDIVVLQSGTTALSNGQPFSLQLIGTGTTYEDFSWRGETVINSFGSTNAGQIFG